MDKKLIGYILVAAAIYYMMRREDGVAASASQSQLDVNNVDDSGHFIESNMSYMNDTSVEGLG